VEKGWAKILNTADLQKAEIIRAMLEENNIPCISLNKRDSAYPVFGEIELYVTSADALKAVQLIKSQTDV
jgi:hypothetical protein